MKATWDKENYSELISAIEATYKYIIDSNAELESKMHKENCQRKPVPWYKKLVEENSTHTFCKGDCLCWSEDDWNLHFRKINSNALRNVLTRVTKLVECNPISITLSSDDIELIQKYSCTKS